MLNVFRWAIVTILFFPYQPVIESSVRCSIPVQAERNRICRFFRVIAPFKIDYKPVLTDIQQTAGNLNLYFGTCVEIDMIFSNRSLTGDDIISA